MKLNLKYLLVVCIAFVCAQDAMATHNRAGEITYTHVSGNTYEVTITTCTKTSVIADRQWLPIDWGDGQIGMPLDSLERVSIQEFPAIDAQINTYVGTHTYPGPGAYTLSVEDPNRNNGVINIPNSVDTPFCIKSELIINPQTGHNNSVQLLNPPKERACLDKLWIHNPGAYDPDGDYLTYELVTCYGENCQAILGYQFPDVSTDVETDTFVIDAETGDLVWDAPPVLGEFNAAILITEWRLVDGTYVKVGSVLRDMQITVEICDNNPPEIADLSDTCIVIDDVLQFGLSVTDPDGDPIFLSAIGGPFQVENFATFNGVTGTFTWQPDCEEVRAEPYFVSFKAVDNDPVQLTDIETIGIRVVAPSVENPFAEPAGNNIQLTWDPHDCLNAFPESTWDEYSYKIYRRQGLYGFEPDYCETGVPEYTGYELVGSVEGLDSDSYLDSNNLGFGGLYCYMIVTCWPDGAESKASVEVCTELVKDAPVLTNVSVLDTDEESGEMYLAWSPPTELDTTNWTGPYQYRLIWKNTGETIYESSQSDFLIWGDTIYDPHSGIDTRNIQHNYDVQFYSGGELVSTSLQASSVFITLEPNDNQLAVNINHQVPWNNYEYEVYLFDEDLGDFVLDGISTETTYVIDSLVNNVEYCVQVKAIGTFNTPDIIDPLINWSQEACGKPYDLTPPCPPELTVENDCIQIVDWLDWTNPNNICADDVIAYNIYFAPTEATEPELIATIDDANDTSYVYNELGEFNSIAGCFYVTALDSLLPGPDGVLIQNESEPSNRVCVDNCPIYFLPNVFSPNNDLVNDLFVPFPYKFIESIDFKVFNRWGGEVFSTTDPEIQWDGTHQDTGLILSDGVYYYTIRVFTIRLAGIVEEQFSGTIQLINGQNPLSE